MARKYVKKAFLVRVQHLDGDMSDYYADQRGLTSIKALFHCDIFVKELDLAEANRFLALGQHVKLLDK